MSVSNLNGPLGHIKPIEAWSWEGVQLRWKHLFHRNTQKPYISAFKDDRLVFIPKFQVERNENDSISNQIISQVVRRNRWDIIEAYKEGGIVPNFALEEMCGFWRKALLHKCFLRIEPFKSS